MSVCQKLLVIFAAPCDFRWQIMKPLFFINCCQKQHVTETRRPVSNTNTHMGLFGGCIVNVIEDYAVASGHPETENTRQTESLITTTVYFTFLSESQRGNKIIIRVYDECDNELPDVYLYEFEKSERPERIDIPLYVPKNSRKKHTYKYKVCNISMCAVYFEGKFVIVPPKFKGHMTVGFLCMSKKNAAVIPKYSLATSEASNQIQSLTDVWAKVLSWRDMYNFDVLVLGGNFSCMKTLFHIYKSRGGVTEIFQLFRKFVLQFYGDNSVSRVLRENWNISTFGDLDILAGDEHNGSYSSALNEFIYYARIMYENYFIHVPRSPANCLQFRQVCGSLNMITVDALSSFALESVYYTEKNVLHVQRSLHAEKLNIVLLNRPLRYLNHREPSAEKMLKCLIAFAQDHKIKVLSFHKNGISYMQTHSCGGTSLDECVVSGLTTGATSESFVKRKRIRLGISWRRKRDVWAARRDRSKIVTRNHRGFQFQGSGCVLINNFLMCAAASC